MYWLFGGNSLKWTSLESYILVPEGQKFTGLMRDWNCKLEIQQNQGNQALSLSSHKRTTMCASNNSTLASCILLYLFLFASGWPLVPLLVAEHFATESSLYLERYHPSGSSSEQL